MSDDINYQNNPLHGLSLKNMLIELIDHYGFEILYAYLQLNCFKNNPDVKSAVIFLKKTDWAREKTEAFYLYEYKNLPRASSEQFEIPPRDRIIPNDHKAGEPRELSLEDAEQRQQLRAKKAKDHNKHGAYGPKRGTGNTRGTNTNCGRSNSRGSSSYKDNSLDDKPANPWASVNIKTDD